MIIKPAFFDEREKRIYIILDKAKKQLAKLQKIQEAHPLKQGLKLRYKAICQNKGCEWEGTKYSYIVKATVQEFAEIHMMKTGHVVDIVQV